MGNILNSQFPSILNAAIEHLLIKRPLPRRINWFQNPLVLFVQSGRKGCRLWSQPQAAPTKACNQLNSYQYAWLDAALVDNQPSNRRVWETGKAWSPSYSDDHSCVCYLHFLYERPSGREMKSTDGDSVESTDHHRRNQTEKQTGRRQIILVCYRPLFLWSHPIVYHFWQTLRRRFSTR